MLGRYTLALELAQLPIDKVVATINQVSFSAFSKLQGDTKRFRALYLTITKVTAALVLPLCVGGFWVGDDLVKIFLNSQWHSIGEVFRYLCLVQIATALNAVNNFVHTSQGRPHWRLSYYAACAVMMPLSFSLVVDYGFRAILIPWLTTYMALCVTWIWITLRRIDIRLVDYFRALRTPVASMLAMSVALLVVTGLTRHWFASSATAASVATRVFCGGLVYCAAFLALDRRFFRTALTIATA
jgi:O-antigen/teichoic acid export membrane protein